MSAEIFFKLGFGGVTEKLTFRENNSGSVKKGSDFCERHFHNKHIPLAPFSRAHNSLPAKASGKADGLTLVMFSVCAACTQDGVTFF